MTTYSDLIRTAHIATSNTPICNLVNSDWFITNEPSLNTNLNIDITSVKQGNHWDFRTISDINSTCTISGPNGMRVRIVSTIIYGNLNVLTNSQISTIAGPILISAIQGSGISGRIFIVDTKSKPLYDIDIRIFAHSTSIV